MLEALLPVHTNVEHDVKVLYSNIAIQQLLNLIRPRQARARRSFALICSAYCRAVSAISSHRCASSPG
jgi:hypothetical protein